MLASAFDALLIMLDPQRLLILSSGVLMGLFLGIVPGLGGLMGMALILPFTFSMDPYSAIAILLGITAVTGTSDTIPAVLIGVPGTAGAQATVMDGHPMAKRGEAGRALAAAYTASLLGGLAGAFLLALSIPAVRPFILSIGSPELLAISVFGISMVAMLSGSAPLRGLVAAGIGVMIAMVGADPQTGTVRWSMGSLYLWDGLPLVPFVLGLFALPELADMAIRRTSIASSGVSTDPRAGMRQGIGDAFRNIWLVLRCGGVGAVIGAIPGLGSSVVDWIAYGYAKATIKDADKTFGKGDVRGVIAPESANNSITAGALVPTIAFGVPGTAGMALVLGAFMIHGLNPGPDMLTKHLDVTYSMVWSIAIANILGAGICILFSGQLAKIATLRYTLIMPTVIAVVCIGAYQASRSWGDLFVLVGFGVVGWIMKRAGWPRPPLILGFVLGSIIENYLFISIGRYGSDWLSRPLVMIFFAMAILGLAHPILKEVKRQGGWKHLIGTLGVPVFRPRDLMHLAVIALVGLLLWQATGWRFAASIGPLVVGIFTLVVVGVSLLIQVLRNRSDATAEEEGEAGATMDTQTDLSDLGRRTIATRAMAFIGWLAGFMVSTATIGMIPTVPLFIIAYMRLEGKEPWRIVLLQAVIFTAFVYYLFHVILHLYWPPTLLGQLLPQMRFIPSV